VPAAKTPATGVIEMARRGINIRVTTSSSGEWPAQSQIKTLP
jgi:hypothetical protein